MPCSETQAAADSHNNATCRFGDLELYPNNLFEQLEVLSSVCRRQAVSILYASNSADATCQCFSNSIHMGTHCRIAGICQPCCMKTCHDCCVAIWINSHSMTCMCQHYISRKQGRQSSQSRSALSSNEPCTDAIPGNNNRGMSTIIGCTAHGACLDSLEQSMPIGPSI